MRAVPTGARPGFPPKQPRSRPLFAARVAGGIRVRFHPRPTEVHIRELDAATTNARVAPKRDDVAFMLLSTARLRADDL
jgi:hypothetical protein